MSDQNDHLALLGNANIKLDRTFRWGFFSSISCMVLGLTLVTLNFIHFSFSVFIVSAPLQITIVALLSISMVVCLVSMFRMIILNHQIKKLRKSMQ